MGVYRLELSKSARALCKNAECQKKQVKIGKGELRWCSLVTIKENQSWQYKHWGCVTPKQIANLRETIENDLDLLDGYDELDTESQDKVRRALADGHVDDSDWKGDLEQNRPGKTGFRSPKKKSKPPVEDLGNEDGTPSPSKPSKKKRGRAKFEENDDAADINEPSAKKHKKKSSKGKKIKGDDALSGSELEAHTTKSGRTKRAKAQTNAEEFGVKEENSDHDTVPKPPRKETARTKKTAKPKEIKAEDSDEGVGTGEASNPRRSHKRAAAPSTFDREDEQSDSIAEDEAYETKKVSKKVEAVKNVKAQDSEVVADGKKSKSAAKQKNKVEDSVTINNRSTDTVGADLDIDSPESGIIVAAPKAKRGAKKAASVGSKAVG